MTYALHRPLRGLPVHLVLLWPLVFARIMLLKLWVRRHYGRGVPYRFRLDWWGRVTLSWMPADLCRAATAPAPLMAGPAPFAFTCGQLSRALARACATLPALCLPSPPPLAGVARPAPPPVRVAIHDSS